MTMPSKKRRRKIVVLSDEHCGHIVGLTPPSWQWAGEGGTRYKRAKFHRVQQEIWNRYYAYSKQIGPVDLVVHLGDMIDGKGERSGGAELLTGDRQDQVDMAVECARVWKTDQRRVILGTPYHSGACEEWEIEVARDLDCKWGIHDFVEINGVVFDLKHHIGRSEVPHTRSTALAREAYWNLIWNVSEYAPRANWILRGHVHYSEWCGRYVGSEAITAMTAPSLQGMGTRFGAKRMSGTVHWGLIYIEVTPAGRAEVEPIVTVIETQKTSPDRLFTHPHRTRKKTG